MHSTHYADCYPAGLGRWDLTTRFWRGADGALLVQDGPGALLKPASTQDQRHYGYLRMFQILDARRAAGLPIGDGLVAQAHRRAFPNR